MYLVTTKILLFFLFINSSVCQEFVVYPQSNNSFLWYDQDTPDTYTDYLEQINNFLKENKTFENVEPKNWGPCVSSNSYGYLDNVTGPCVFIYFPNKLIATPYNSTTLPKDAPDSLQKHIKTQEGDPNQANKTLAYVTCDGVYPVDKTNIGPVHIYKSFEVDIDPNSPGHKLIAVHLENPKRSKLIDIHCTLWALFNSTRNTKDRVVIYLGLMLKFES